MESPHAVPLTVQAMKLPIHGGPFPRLQNVDSVHEGLVELRKQDDEEVRVTKVRYIERVPVDEQTMLDRPISWPHLRVAAAMTYGDFGLAVLWSRKSSGLTSEWPHLLAV